MVLQEDRCSEYCNSTSRSCTKKPAATGKKSKPKIPQRGLGVAQLERIRIAEQEKNSGSGSGSGSSSSLILPVQPPQPPVSLLAASSDSNSLFRPPFDPSPLFRPYGPPSTQHACMMSSSGSHGHGFLPMLWDADGALKKYGYHQQASSIQNDSSNHGLKSSGFWHRKHYQHQQQSPASMVNRTLSPSSSGVNLQMEPPSNQSYGSNHNMPSSWPEEEKNVVKMVGMKRPCPFHIENASNHPNFSCPVSFFSSSFVKSDESLQRCGMFAALREGGDSSSSSYQVDIKSSNLFPDKSVKENGATKDAGFLSLGSITKSKQSMAISSHHHCEYPEFNLLPYQGNGDDAVSDFKDSKQVPFYSFLPMGPNNCDATLSDRRGEALDGGIDLNLKL